MLIRFEIFRRATFLKRASRLTVLSLSAIALLFMAFLAGCGGGSGGGGGGSSKSTTVTGTVQDSANNDAGVSGAKITIGGATATTTTTANATSANPVGTFTITNASVGATTAVIVVGTTTQTIAFSPSITNGANNIGSLFINIGQISGRVLLPSGSPALGAFVSITGNGATANTPADGTFLLTNVPIGTTQLVVVLGTASLTTTINVGTGITVVGDLKLVDNTSPNPPGIPTTIAGTVLLGGSGGGAAPGTEVFLFRNGSQIESTATDSAGSYSFYVPVGTYSIEFSRASFVTTTVSAAVVDSSVVLTVPTVTLQPQ